jgi:hypothetical protein
MCAGFDEIFVTGDYDPASMFDWKQRETGHRAKLLQVTSQWADAFDVLLNQYQRIGESVPAFVLVQSLSDDRGHRTEIINSIFRNVFDFHKLALHFFKKTGLTLRKMR